MSDDQHRSVDGGKPKATLWAGAWRLLSLCNNPLSALGLFLVAISVALLGVFFGFALIVGGQNPYVDVVGFLVLPGVLVMGMVLTPVGSFWKWRWLRKHAGEKAPRYVQINFGDPTTVAAIGVFLAISLFVVLPTLAVAGYQSYHYTESTEFCAGVCHTVMEPQGTAHATSPHARVSCAECHIGEGADWFVKSKLSGTRQVLAVWRDSFHRPIPPAITELRPARDTCEECHWPDKFYGWQYSERVHYSPDQQNTRRVLRMMVHTGGADYATAQLSGIHMHMLVAGSVDYVAVDEHLQEIPWVRYTRQDGTTTVYRSDGEPVDAPPPAGIRRTVDCMDCHNRGAHHFYPPQKAIDAELEAGRIDANLPYVKRIAVEALVGDYEDVDAATDGIAQQISGYYAELTAPPPSDAVASAVAATQAAYRRNFFPAMKVDWRTYPENIGHMYSPGCFRCHDGLHVDSAGVAISSDCTVCHEFLNPVAGSDNAYEQAGFEHSMPLTAHEELRCSQCHSGGQLLLCRDCHANLRGLNAWTDIPRLRRPK